MVVGESVTIFYRIYSCAVVHFDALFDSLFKESCSSLEEKKKKKEEEEKKKVMKRM
jgi:hypothetical protein